MTSIGVAQFAPVDDRDRNLDTIAGLARSAASRGASLVVFPEYSSYFTPEPGPHWRDAAEDAAGPFVAALSGLARELGIHLVVGMLQPATDHRVSNAVVALDPSGSVVATYRKIHLYDAFGQRESEWVEPGPVDQPATLNWEGFTVGLQTCYDVRFPEVTRRLVDAGADVVAIPSEWVRGPLKEHHWRTLVTARALENTVYVAAADHAPPIGVGNSMVVDPMGVELVTIGDETAVTVTEVSRERIDSVRAVNPALRLRRLGPSSAPPSLAPSPRVVSPEGGVSGDKPPS